MASKKSTEKPFDLSIIENSHVIDVELNSEMKKSYIDYAMSVIVSRALPDVRDGLKPVHRRILYDMYESNLLYENDFRKSAATVGDVLGKYHPHGDASVYDAMVRLAQDFSLRYPLVQGKGNFGSIDGDPAAAYRYTEAKMSKIAAEMLREIEKETVDFVPNYDDKLKEPGVLPARYPNLLVNGSNGIAVGMATNIPPHNLCEVIDGIKAVIDDPEISMEELMQYIKGPDFPTGGLIMGKSGIRAAYATGRGKLIMRAKAEIEEHNGRNRIVVTELPYQVNKQRLELHINELVRDGKIEGIASTRDESDENINFIIELKKDANANVVLNNLYKYTQMQDTFGVILLALVDNEPKILNLREIVDYYIAHQEDVIRRRTEFDLRKAREHAHLLEGYRIAIDNIEDVIETIRRSRSIPDAKAALCERFGLDEIQATAIVQMQLGRLSGLEREKIEEDYAATMQKISEYEAILADESAVLNIIKEDLEKIKEKYGDERRTELAPLTDEIDIEDLIEREDVAVMMSHNGYVKRMPISEYKSQHRGGRGITGMTTREEDYVEKMLTGSSHDLILFFTNRGVVYKLKAYQIPESGRTARGSAIVNILPLESEEKVSVMLPVNDMDEDKYLFFVTKNGTIKKTAISAYANIRNGGLRAINLDDDDELIFVGEVGEDDQVMLLTHNGMSIMFNIADIRSLGRVTRGVRGINLADDDYVIGAGVAGHGKLPLVVSERGYGKKTDVDAFRIQNRGGKGLKAYKTTDKTGLIAGLEMVDDDDDVLMITDGGIVIRIHASEISTIGRNTQGVRLMKLGEDVKLISVSLVKREDEADEVAEGEITDAVVIPEATELELTEPTVEE